MNPMQTDYSHAGYARQLETKVAEVSALLAPLAPPTAAVYRSPVSHYRQRAEFRIWHEGDDLFYAMFDPSAAGAMIRIEQFPPASIRINTLMRELREILLQTPCLRQRLFQVEFLSTLSGEAMLTLIYHRPLDADWSAAASELESCLQARVIGRSRRQRLVLSDAHVTEVLQLDHGSFNLRQPESCFTQPNAEVNRAMLHWAHGASQGVGGGLVELYCGIGNFTVALAADFERVLATEINKTAIQAAQHNLLENGIDNTFVARLASEEAAAALSRERAFRRLKDFDLDSFDATTVLVDPPRAGLDAATRALVGGFRRIIYVSCNPHTLQRDLLELGASHGIDSLALFDQFPYTPHMECGVLLERRGS